MVDQLFTGRAKGGGYQDGGDALTRFVMGKPNLSTDVYISPELLANLQWREIRDASFWCTSDRVESLIIIAHACICK